MAAYGAVQPPGGNASQSFAWGVPPPKKGKAANSAAAPTVPSAGPLPSASNGISAQQSTSAMLQATMKAAAPPMPPPAALKKEPSVTNPNKLGPQRVPATPPMPGHPKPAADKSARAMTSTSKLGAPTKVVVDPPAIPESSSGSLSARCTSSISRPTAASRGWQKEEPLIVPERPKTARARISVPGVASKTTSASRAQAYSVPVEEPAAPPVVPSGPAKAKAPELSTAKRADKVKPPTSEELELLNAMREMKEQQIRRDKWRSQLDKVLADAGTTLPARSTLQLTVPEEFEFHATRSEGDAPGSPQSKPLAQQVLDFHKTPKRFRTKAAGAQPSPLPQAEQASLNPTTPHPVELSTEQRAAAHRTAVKSATEIEAELMASMPKFRALPLNKKVMESGSGSGHLGVPRVQKPPPTQIEAFNLSSSARGESKPATLQSSSSEPTFKFKARPLNKDIMEGKASGLTGVTPRKSTQPHSPHLSTTNRAAARGPAPHEELETFALFKARPMPVYSPSVATATKGSDASQISRPVTAPKPFSLTSEARHSAALAAFKQQLEREKEEVRQARQFKARPMPVGDAWVPEHGKTPQSAREQRPFNLQTEARHEIYESSLQERLREAEADLRKSRQFHARSADVIHKQKFVPNKSTKPLTEINSYDIRSEKRAEERRKWEEAAAAARAERERLQREAEIEKLKREAEEIAEMRKKMVWHARPATVLKAKPFKPHLNSSRSASAV